MCVFDAVWTPPKKVIFDEAFLLRAGVVVILDNGRLRCGYGERLRIGLF